MPSVKAFYKITRYHEGQARDGRYFIELEFEQVHDTLFNDTTAPRILKDRFYDYKRAQDLIACDERVALLVDFESKGRSVIVMAATEGDLEQFMRPASVSSSSNEV